MATPLVVKALWPPALGWAPVAIGYTAPERFGPHGPMWFWMPIVLLAAVVAAPFGVANVVRGARWREMAPQPRFALVAANLSFPLGFGALVLFS